MIRQTVLLFKLKRTEERVTSRSRLALHAEFLQAMEEVNLAQKMLTMPEAWQTKTIKSIRWMLVEVAGRLIRRSRRIILQIAAGIEKYTAYLEIRRRTYELMRA